MVKYWQEQQANLDSYDNYEDDRGIIYFIGGTGAGKSTTINFSNGAKYTFNKYHQLVRKSEGEGYGEESHELESCTTEGQL